MLAGWTWFVEKGSLCRGRRGAVCCARVLVEGPSVGIGSMIGMVAQHMKLVVVELPPDIVVDIAEHLPTVGRAKIAVVG